MGLSRAPNPTHADVGLNLLVLAGVFIVTLNASSAFDKVNIYGLMTKLIKRNVPFDVIRTLLSWYTYSIACVKLSKYYSECISIKSGVK